MITLESLLLQKLRRMTVPNAGETMDKQNLSHNAA